MLQEAEVLARASGVRTIRIGVLARNRVARELYERQGFEPYHVQLVKPL
jgi:ribosomal protein S18 acetylase RimI-like enzyme